MYGSLILEICICPLLAGRVLVMMDGAGDGSMSRLETIKTALSTVVQTYSSEKKRSITVDYVMEEGALLSNLGQYSVVVVDDSEGEGVQGQDVVSSSWAQSHLHICRKAGVACTTHDMVLTYAQSPALLDRILMPWGLSVPFNLRELAARKRRLPHTTTRTLGFRRDEHNCADCSSWSCEQCSEHQGQFAAHCGPHHARDIGAEWRDMY